jgi:3-oxoadipate enol-lactonase
LLADRSAFERAALRLARKRRVWLVNLPGYGGSSALEGDSIEDYADHIAALLDVLEVGHDADILGNGFGGFIAVALAARHSRRIARLVAAPALTTFPESAKQPFYRLADLASTKGMHAVLDLAIGRMFSQAFARRPPRDRGTAQARTRERQPAVFPYGVLRARQAR